MTKFAAEARRAVADGASVIIPSPAFIATLAHRSGITQLEGALVLDTVSVAVKRAEMLVDLRKAGVQPSRRIGVYCQPEAAMRDDALRRFGKVFTIR